jgi:ferredoxin
VDVELDADALARRTFRQAGVGGAGWPALSLAVAETVQAERPPTPGADAPAYEAGRIPDTALSALPLAEAVCFLCGPVPFMEEMRARLLALGAQDIRHEVFATPADTPLEMRPIPEPGPFRVSFGAGESTWQAGDGTLLEFGEGAGVKLASNCRSGVCGACKVKLRSGAVAHLLDAPFPLAPDDVLTCCAVPLGDVRLEA